MTLDQLNALSEQDFVATLEGVVEHSSWVVERVSTQRPFATVAALSEALREAIEQAGDAAQLALLRAHPELGRSGPLTAASAAEQQSQGLDRLATEEAERFTELNLRYRARFGFPFIIAVRGQRDRAAILAALEQRLENAPKHEQAIALAEVAKIVRFRLDARVAASPPVSVTSGRLTIHVLDTARGVPAEGVALTLDRLAETRREHLGRWRTNADGRCDQPLLVGAALQPGVYELSFETGEWQHGTRGDPGFYETIPIRFRVTDMSAHYHVPLLLAPYGYSTYRGS